MNQINESISGQRQAALQDLDNAQAKFRGTLQDFRETAAATDKLADRLTTFVHAADGFAARSG